MNWREIPFFRLLLPFIIGICFAAYPEVKLSWPVFLAFPFLFGALWYSWQRRNTFHYRWIYGAVLSAFLILLGYQLTAIHNELNRPHHFQHAIAKENYLVGEIQQLRASEKSMRLLLKVNMIGSTADSMRFGKGFLLTYLDLDARSRSLNYGDRILLKGNIRPIDPARNPKAFDFAHFMHLNNTHFSTRADSASWQKLNEQPSNSLLALTDRLRQRCINILRKHLPTDNEFAVGAALVLGYKDEITDEVRNAYINTGAMHILAVSGMHVAIVYMSIVPLLGLLKLKGKQWRFIKMLILLAAVWGFALLTGASPSVLRAAAMLSFVIVGESFERRPNIYNTLASSAFLLLCVNPYLLFNIGFQLSYLAVLGIVYFQPPIYRLWYIKNKIGDYFWKLIALSLAAQIATAPISLYYFHQFPVYFILSGLAVVPVAGIILMGAISLFILDGIPVLGWLLGQGLYWLIWLSNAAIFLIQQIPGGLLTGIWVSAASAVLLYTAIAALSGAFELRKFRWVLVAMACFLSVSAIYALREWQNQTRRQVVVYHTPGHTVIDFVDGKKILSLDDGKLDASQLHFSAGNYRLFLGARHILPYRLDSLGEQSNEVWFHQNDLVQFHEFSMAIIRPPLKAKAGSSKIAVDYLLLSGNVWADIEELLQIFDCKLVLFDASCSYSRVRRWKEACTDLGIPYYDIREQGAWVCDL